MDEMRTTQDAPSTITRRTFFSRALLVAGAGVALVGLTGCPGGEQDDDDDDDDDD